MLLIRKTSSELADMVQAFKDPSVPLLSSFGVDVIFNSDADALLHQMRCAVVDECLCPHYEAQCRSLSKEEQRSETEAPTQWRLDWEEHVLPAIEACSFEDFHALALASQLEAREKHPSSRNWFMFTRDIASEQSASFMDMVHLKQHRELRQGATPSQAHLTQESPLERLKERLTPTCLRYVDWGKLKTFVNEELGLDNKGDRANGVTDNARRSSARMQGVELGGWGARYW